MKKLIILGAVIALTGCSGANITSHVRDSQPGESKTIRCVDVDSGEPAKANYALSRFDGWKMVYSSEYTTKHRKDTAVRMCFERDYPVKK